MAHRPIAGRLVIATHNPGKLAEMRELLAVYGIDAISAGELGLPSRRKPARRSAPTPGSRPRPPRRRRTCRPLPTNSGLAVDALDGQPGIYSARWAGPDKDFRLAMNKIQSLLIEHGAKSAERRRGHFVSALCVAWPDGHVEEFEATVDGTVVWPPRGNLGFGYDPLFLPDGQTQTFGEMPSEEKHGLPPHGRGLSHRARAFLKLAEACLGKR